MEWTSSLVRKGITQVWHVKKAAEWSHSSLFSLKENEKQKLGTYVFFFQLLESSWCPEALKRSQKASEAFRLTASPMACASGVVGHSGSKSSLCSIIPSLVPSCFLWRVDSWLEWSVVPRASFCLGRWVHGPTATRRRTAFSSCPS